MGQDERGSCLLSRWLSSWVTEALLMELSSDYLQL